MFDELTEIVEEEPMQRKVRNIPTSRTIRGIKVNGYDKVTLTENAIHQYLKQCGIKEGWDDRYLTNIKQHAEKAFCKGLVHDQSENVYSSGNMEFTLVADLIVKLKVYSG